MEEEQNVEEIEENFYEVSGMLIDEENILLNPDEIENFSINNIKKVQIKQVLKIKYTLCDEILLNLLKDYFKVESISQNTYKICSQITLYLHKNNDTVLEWYSNGYSDFLANSIAMIITQLELAPDTNVFYHYSNNDSICSYKKDRLINYLKSKYSQVDIGTDSLKVWDNGENAIIKFKELEIYSENEKIRQKLHLDIELFKEL